MTEWPRSSLSSNAWQAHPQAPMAGSVIGHFGDIVEERGKEFAFGEGLNAFRLFVVRKGERCYGYVNLCPHYSLPLNVRPDEFLTRDGGRIMCRRHLAIFTIEDGLCVEGACTGSRLDAVPVSVDSAGTMRIG